MNLEKKLDNAMDILSYWICILVLVVTLPIWILPHLKHKNII